MHGIAYLWAKVIMSDNTTQTMPMLISNLISGYVTNYGMLMLAVRDYYDSDSNRIFTLQEIFCRRNYWISEIE